jgi:pimeloyl-ACP methyl ester carboxylesterase
LVLALGLLLLGALATLFSASRRPRFERRWEDLTDAEPFEMEPRGPAAEPPARRREVAGPAGRLVVDDGGEGGTPVLFVHGLGGSAGQWREQLSVLRAGCRALALDLRGHGASEPSREGAYGIEDYAADVLAVADGLGLGCFALVGHSLGGSVVLAVAARAPERVAAVLLADPNGDQSLIPREELASFREALARDAPGEMGWYFKQILVGAGPTVADRVLADLAACDPAALRPSLEAAFSHSPVADLATYGGPVLSVVSELNDLPFSLHRVTELETRLLGGTSHWLMMDRPQDFNRILGEFLSRLADSRGPGG